MIWNSLRVGSDLERGPTAGYIASPSTENWLIGAASVLDDDPPETAEERHIYCGSSSRGRIGESASSTIALAAEAIGRAGSMLGPLSRQAIGGLMSPVKASHRDLGSPVALRMRPNTDTQTTATRVHRTTRRIRRIVPGSSAPIHSYLSIASAWPLSDVAGPDHHRAARRDG